MRSGSPLMPLFWILLALTAAICLMLYSPFLFGYILIGVAITVGTAAAGVIIYVIYWLVSNKLSRICRVTSRVIRRRKKDWDVSLVGGTPTSAIARLGMMGGDHKAASKAYSREMARGNIPELTLMDGTNYFVTFDVNGHEVEFSVTEADYIKCSEGAKGLLVFQGEEFKHFIPNVG
ncbi:DUF2500 domain-containing protein [bacterium]|nr:DUF2500 domain-containing protein [bacterium]